MIAEWLIRDIETGEQVGPLFENPGPLFRWMEENELSMRTHTFTVFPLAERMRLRCQPGHELEVDPPAHGLGSGSRLTCARCRMAVLHNAGNFYGQATEKACPNA